jgi:SAM-dependent methyltransferase
MNALAVEHGERVVDLGCGPGTTTVELARRVAPYGQVLGVDISPAMVAAANRRARAAGATNVRLIVADAQTEEIGSDFDAAYSRFGVMFFTDPLAAFANIGRSLRAGGRLGCAVWGPLTDNPWIFVPTLAAAAALNTELNIPGSGEPGPFSLAETERVHEVLDGAGFIDISVDRVDGSRLITSGTVGDNVTTLLEVGPLGEAFEAADDRTRQLAIDAVLTAIEPYREGDGWRLPGTAFNVMARRP